MIKIIALVGKAGSGKDTLLHNIMKQYPDLFHQKISCTTRPPREGEREGIDYYFLSDEEFNKKIASDDMIEFSTFNNWNYGTSKTALSREKINIGIFNPQGILNLIKDKDIDLLKIFEVRAPDKERLLRQLNREINPDVKEIVRRFSADEKDFQDFYTYIANNKINVIKLDNIFIGDIDNLVRFVVGQIQ